MRRPAALLLPFLVILVAACATTPPPSSPTATPGVTPAPAAEAPSSPADPSPSPTSPVATPIATPIATPAPESPAPSMTAEEEALIRELRTDAALDCVARRTGLPEGAMYGVECRADDASVARVGVYWYAEPNGAAFAYMKRMASQGVDVSAGNCSADVPGDSAWTPGDHEGDIGDPGVFNWENSVLSPDRVGCFVDENGNANVRATCGNTYIGVLGTGPDLSGLHDWTWRYPEGYEPGTPDAPGVCVGPRTAASVPAAP